MNKECERCGYGLDEHVPNMICTLYVSAEEYSTLSDAWMRTENYKRLLSWYGLKNAIKRFLRPSEDDKRLKNYLSNTVIPLAEKNVEHDKSMRNFRRSRK